MDDAKASGSWKDDSIVLNRLGSEVNCTDVKVPDGEFVEYMRVVSDNVFVSSIQIHFSGGEFYRFGELNPIMDNDNSAFNHTVYNFTDEMRLMGAFGHELELTDGTNELVGVGFIRNHCNRSHFVKDEQKVFAIVLLVTLMVCGYCCCCYCCLKHRAKLCPCIKWKANKKTDEQAVELPQDSVDVSRQGKGLPEGPVDMNRA
jgi:hypothetical protein